MPHMSTKLWAASFLTVGILAGAVIGALGTFYVMADVGSSTMSALMTKHARIDAEEHLSLARQLERGDSAAVRQRVALLLGADLPWLQSTCRQRDVVGYQGACSLLRADAQYLQAHPLSTGSADFDEMIQRAVQSAEAIAAPTTASRATRR